MRRICILDHFAPFSSNALETVENGDFYEAPISADMNANTKVGEQSKINWKYVLVPKTVVLPMERTAIGTWMPFFFFAPSRPHRQVTLRYRLSLKHSHAVIGLSRLNLATLL